MAISSIGMLLSQSDKTAGTSFNVATESANLTAGRIGILVIAKDNTSTTDGNTTEVTSVTDAAGNVWNPAREFCNGQGTAATGATVSVWWTKAIANLGNGSNITVNLSASITAKAVIGWVFSVGSGNTLSQENQSDLANDNADAGSITISGLSNIEHLFIRGIAVEDNFTTFTATTSWTAFDHTGANTTGTPAASNQTARGEFRIVTATSGTSDPTTSNSDQASTLIAFKEITAPTILARRSFVGTRSGSRQPL